MKINLFTKFLLRMFILTSILLISIILEKQSLINLNDIKEILQRNINIVEITKKVNGELGIIDLGDNVINVSLNDSESIKIGENEYLYKQKNENIYSTILGSVVKIKKVSNDSYDIVIMDENSNLITYSKIKEVKVKMYQIIKVNDLIGVASLNNDINKNDYLYYYLLTIDEN